MKEIQKVTVIGAGIMGAGIAHAIFKHGLEVTLFDLNKEVLEQTYKGVRSKARKSMNPENIKMTNSLAKAAMDTDLIIEAVVEDLEVKCKLFKELGELAAENTIFASNTSSLSIAQMAKASGRPDSFLGLHFFNPALIMRLVEVVVSNNVSVETQESIENLLSRIKKTGVKCVESPAFIVNRILVPVVNEAFYLLDEISSGSNQDIVSIANDIDSALVKDGVLPMGVFDLADLTGIDTIFKVSQVIYNGFNQSARYMPAPLLTNYFEKGSFGRKSRQGIFYYENTANDPDLNPRLNMEGRRIENVETPQFLSLDLVCVIVNEACRVLEEGLVETFADIDRCMELGARWGKGPFALAKDVGIENIYHRLKLRAAKHKDGSRYEPSELFSDMSHELRTFLMDDQIYL